MDQWHVLYCLINGGNQTGHMISMLKPEFFLETLQRNIYIYIEELLSKNIKLDINIIASKFPDYEIIIKSNLNEIVDVDSYEEYISNLRSNFINQEAKRIANGILSKDKIDEDRFLEYINDFTMSISSCKETNILFASEVADKILYEVNKEEEPKSSVTYGINSLDEHTGGIWKTEYTVLAGRPSMGKSGLLGHIACTNALNGVNTLLFSLEMSAVKIMTRMIASMSNLELWKLKRIKHRDQNEQSALLKAIETIKKSPLVIETTGGITVNQIKSTIQKLILQGKKPELVLVDYLQLMDGPGENDNSRVSRLSKNMKNIAVQFEIAVISVSQLSRSCEQREDKRPILADLRDSGAIEQDADLVFMLYRDHYYNYNPEHERILEILIRKFRNGETSKIVVDYNLKKQSFKSINFNTAIGQIAKKFMYV